MKGEAQIQLSEAIRLGSMLGPQCYGHYIEEVMVPTGWLMGYLVTMRTERHTCAIGAALMAVGRTDLLDLANPEQVFPQLLMEVASPFSGRMDSLWDVIVTLNDSCRWTRALIADWVATVENGAVGLPEDEDEVPEAEVCV